MLMNRKTTGSPLQKHTKSVLQAPDGEREMKHKYCCDVGLCFLSFTDWNLQRVENNNNITPFILYSLEFQQPSASFL